MHHLVTELDLVAHADIFLISGQSFPVKGAILPSGYFSCNMLLFSLSD
jgi:hypothetical protein